MATSASAMRTGASGARACAPARTRAWTRALQPPPTPRRAVGACAKKGGNNAGDELLDFLQGQGPHRQPQTHSFGGQVLPCRSAWGATGLGAGGLFLAAACSRTCHGRARHGTARHGTARHGTARHGTACQSIAERACGALCTCGLSGPCIPAEGNIACLTSGTRNRPDACRTCC
eukprot:351987-Chlamydomonas_euryale.AAC.4